MQIKRSKTLSLKKIHICMVATLIITSIIVVFSIVRLTNTFMYLAQNEKQHATLKQASHELMDASDYLTQQVQRFVATGDTAFMDNYFNEANVSRRREKAIDTLKSIPNANKALLHLQEAMKESLLLMNREYYAMRLIIDAYEIKEYPSILETVIIDDSDATLSTDDKISRATHLVLGNEYYLKKDTIRQNMEKSVSEINRLMEVMENTQQERLKRQILFMHITILLQIVLTTIMVRMTSILGIHPILAAAKTIREDKPVPETGAYEFLCLAKAYNKMYRNHKSSLETLSYKASHDELTGVYNRTGYEAILSSIDTSTVCMMLIDVDDFKDINDRYGHDIGDKALIKLSHTLEHAFREDDYICRIGGDEFMVLIPNADHMPTRLLESKILGIKHELSSSKNEVPPISVSIGIINGKDISPEQMYEMADKAMYRSKQQGKNTYTFYNVKEEKIC